MINICTNKHKPSTMRVYALSSDYMGCSGMEIVRVVNVQKMTENVMVQRFTNNSVRIAKNYVIYEINFI